MKLFVKDVVNAFLQIWDFTLQPDQQPLGDFTQEHAGFTRRVYKDAVFDTNRKSLLRHISAEKGLK